MAPQPQNGSRPLALVLSPLEEDYAGLQRILAGAGWTLARAATMASALDHLRRHPVPIVICARELEEGSWQHFLKRSRDLASPLMVIVLAGAADDRLWGEALGCGAYDVLPKPFDALDVLFSLATAWQSRAGITG